MADQFDVLIKLFETLETAEKDMQKSVEKLTDQQIELVSLIEHLPMKELRDALKEHHKESIIDIESCTETVDSKTDKVLSEIDNVKSIMNILNGKVGKMIWVVSIVFSLASVSYLFIRSVTDVTETNNKLIEIIREEQEIEHEKLIKSIRDEVNKNKK